MITTSRRKLIYFIVYLAYASIYVARVNVSMAGPSLSAAGLVDTVQLGMLGSVFSTTFAIGRLLNGGLSDKAPPWVMITSGLALAGVCNILVGFFPPFIGIFFLWMANAYAQSMLWGSVLCIVSGMYPESIAKKRTAFMSTSVAVGNVIGILLSTWLIAKYGTAYAFVIPGAITILLGGAVLLAARRIEPPPAAEKRHKSMLQLLCDKELLLMCAPAMFHGLIKENISLWMTVYIVDTYFVDLSQSAYYVLLIPVLGFVGRIVHAPLYRLCKENEHRVSLIGFALCIVFAALLSFGKTSALFGVICLSAVYTATSLINVSFLAIYPIRYRDGGNVASVSGVMDFVSYLGAGISSVLYGVLIKHLGYPSMFLSWILLSAIAIFVYAYYFKKQNKERCSA